jgi:long-chain fatty acid transport protein
MAFGLELILPTTQLSSTVNANAFGPGVPGATMSGSDSGEPGVSPVPSMAFVHKSCESNWSYGVGLMGIGGSSVNFPASATNPILSPQPPNGIGLGQLTANVDVLQIVPTIAYQYTPKLSFGFAPTVTMAKLYANPLFLGPRDVSGATATYSSGVGTRYAWGGGFQFGTYYKSESYWNYGFSFKSPQWMEPFRFTSYDQHGLPREVTFNLYYPMILSLGTSYTGFENWVFGCDLRYFDYANTLGFNHGAYNPVTGAATGLGWKNVMSVAVAVQRQLTDRLSVRAGYCYNDNPITSDAVVFNVASPLIIQHTIATGVSYTFVDDWTLSLAYEHCFRNSVTGPLQVAGIGPIPNTSITESTSADAVAASITKKF